MLTIDDFIALNFDKEPTFEENSGEVMTEPNLSLSLRQIIAKFVAGQPLPPDLVKQGSYGGSVPNMELVDIKPSMRSNQSRIDAILNQQKLINESIKEQQTVPPSEQSSE